MQRMGGGDIGVVSRSIFSSTSLEEGEGIGKSGLGAGRSGVGDPAMGIETTGDGSFGNKAIGDGCFALTFVSTAGGTDLSATTTGDSGPPVEGEMRGSACFETTAAQS